MNYQVIHIENNIVYVDLKKESAPIKELMKCVNNIIKFHPNCNLISFAFIEGKEVDVYATIKVKNGTTFNLSVNEKYKDLLEVTKKPDNYFYLQNLTTTVNNEFLLILITLSFIQL